MRNCVSPRLDIPSASDVAVMIIIDNRQARQSNQDVVKTSPFFALCEAGKKYLVCGNKMQDLPLSTSALTGKPVTADYIHASTLHFRDNTGRTLLLRGVNLSGSAKCPVGHPQQLGDDLWDSAEAGSGLTWVGMPLDLTDGSADVRTLCTIKSPGDCTASRLIVLLRLFYRYTWPDSERGGGIPCDSFLRGKPLNTQDPSNTITITSTMWSKCYKGVETMAFAYSWIPIKT